ncbi:branched-chain amino acid ABC transporter substrate-binding protein [Ancylobacter mangrovi]|uniref:Branched-chain amino acid ABC transporter substrate-binding protein n=1 Tax=Ancylobacter mangrovi TaxID=2972472 RepID=A0A9X2PH81_9HYPH|nr:branched-chain amino acid ABC transporter substrate-binding protein [Ancylobacter mangrovi]MCS0496020.1 branched-chain amino acid ABC transporter substrate-binding protein [Ancylobacter mangrovi]MCS0504562.1 branched-chain amino acid ABC transporter substrate-binding protein [Ancylobacter mangrovi]
MKKLLFAGIALGAMAALAVPASAQVKVGVAGPITGANATFGAQLKNGAEQWAADVNAGGGLLGKKVEIVIGDDASKPEQGISVANKFIADGVKFVLGHFNSGVSIPASEQYDEAGVLMISPASTNPTLTERGLAEVFRTCGRDDQQGAIAAEYILKNLKDKKVAIVHDKTPYGKGLADETKKAMNAGGVEEVVYEGINPGEKDYSALVSKLKAAGVQVLYYGGLHTEAGLLVRQMRDQGMDTVLFSGDGITDKEFWTIAGPGAAGTLMTFGSDPRKIPSAAKVVDEFKKNGIDPEGYVLYTYAAGQVLQQSADATKSLDPEKIAEYMHSGKEFDTVLGKLSFDKKGDRTSGDYVVYVWKDGGYSEL